MIPSPVEAGFQVEAGKKYIFVPTGETYRCVDVYDGVAVMALDGFQDDVVVLFNNDGAVKPKNRKFKLTPVGTLRRGDVVGTLYVSISGPDGAALIIGKDDVDKVRSMDTEEHTNLWREHP